MNGVELLDFSIRNPEPLLDPSYGRDVLIISQDPEKPNNLMRANLRIQELITAYGVVQPRADKHLLDDIIGDLRELLLTTKHINNSEFASFWASCDTSFSLFRASTKQEQHSFLHRAVSLYLDKRHGIYRLHGYTAVSLQAKSDSFAHKRSGQLANRKIRQQCLDHNIQEAYLTPQNTSLPSRSFSIIDGSASSAGFNDLLAANNIRFEWGVKHSGKIPDVAIQFHNCLLIVEHKHMKEFGGGQDKQVIELTDFISYRESQPDVRYVAYLDGVLFNELMMSGGSNKTVEHRNRIRQALIDNPSNYFVNTAGFDELLSRLSAG